MRQIQLSFADHVSSRSHERAGGWRSSRRRAPRTPTTHRVALYHRAQRKANAERTGGGWRSNRRRAPRLCNLLLHRFAPSSKATDASRTPSPAQVGEGRGEGPPRCIFVKESSDRQSVCRRNVGLRWQPIPCRRGHHRCRSAERGIRVVPDKLAALDRMSRVPHGSRRPTQ